jgi:hypothetical protein
MVLITTMLNDARPDAPPPFTILMDKWVPRAGDSIELTICNITGQINRE